VIVFGSRSTDSQPAFDAISTPPATPHADPTDNATEPFLHHDDLA
jgi:hypothetical protein